MRFRHLIFDLDGTLIDSAGDLVSAANWVLDRLGLAPQPPAVITGFIGNGVRRLVQQAVRAGGGRADEAQVDDAHALFLERYAAHLLDTTVVYPGIAQTLDGLREAGATMSVATNKPEAMAVAILDGLGLARSFHAVLGGDSLPTRKPDPAIVHALIARSGVAPDATLLVGDSTVDIATARAARVLVCAVEWGLTPAAVLSAAQPDFVVRDPRELLAIAR